MQPQPEVTEWINMHLELIERTVNDHENELWQLVKEYWIQVNQDNS
jgi:hypothetical protein